MFGVAVIIFLASIVGAKSQGLALHAKQGPRHVPTVMRATQPASIQRVASAPLPFALTEQRLQSRTNAAEVEVPVAVAVEAKEGESATGTAETARPASGPQNALNIFGEPTQQCADGKVVAFAEDAHCTYESYSPKLCVDVQALKKPVLAVKRVGAIGARCMSIWDMEQTAIRSSKDQWYTKPEVNVKCSALPVDVLTSEYTQEEWSFGAVYQKTYDSFFRPGFLYYGTILQDPVASKSNRISARCKRFRKAMNSICNACADQAPNDAAKLTLKKNCQAYADMNAGTTNAALPASYTVGQFAFAGALLGTAFAYAWRFQQRRELERTGQEFLLMA